MVGVAHSLASFAKDLLLQVKHESPWHKMAGNFPSGDLGKHPGEDNTFDGTMGCVFEGQREQ